MIVVFLFKLDEYNVKGVIFKVINLKINWLLIIKLVYMCFILKNKMICKCVILKK